MITGIFFPSKYSLSSHRSLGTSTPIATYPTPADAIALTNANSNPIILDSRGECSVVLIGPTKFILRDASDNIIWTQDGIASVAADPANVVPPGAIVSYAGTTIPTGWLECNGSLVSRVTYAALFANIGTTYGVGDGTTTFALPDLTRRVIVARGGTGTATLANTVGAVGGAEDHTLVIGEIPSHTHSVTVSGANVGVAAGASGVAQYGLTNSGSAGGGAAHNNIQPSIVLVMIIKVS